MEKKLFLLLMTGMMVIFLNGCGLLTAVAVISSFQTYESVMELNWGIDLPDGYEELYYESEPHPRGEGPRYCVLSYADEAALDGFRDWTAVEGPTTYCDSYSELVEETIAHLEVPEEYYPDYANCFWWYQRSTDGDIRDELLMLRKGNILYIIEGFY